MDCLHAQQLLGFLERKNDELDTAEREAVLKHVNQCPACRGALDAERQTDAVVSRAMLDLSVPADLRQKVMQWLAAHKRRLPWKSAVAAIAALVLIALGAIWYLKPLPEVSLSDLQDFAYRVDNWTSNNRSDSVAQFAEAEGLKIIAPPNFDYSYLRRVEIVEFKKQRVLKLTFQRDDTLRAVADVLILPHRQFRVGALPSNGPGLEVIDDAKAGYTFVIFLQEGRLEHLQHSLKN